MGNSAIETHWEQLVRVSGVDAAQASQAFSRLQEAYTEPHRHYHTLAHIEHMLNLLGNAGVGSAVALWAVWYHDYVYLPSRKNNEEVSANIARKDMESMSIDTSSIEKVVRIIELTKNHASTDDDVDLCSVLDADMAILGTERDYFDDYRISVRKEFRTVPKLLYRKGRSTFLKSVLSQESIYKTSWFKDRFEEQARTNIRYELDLLAG